jgi:hypothetical protein
LAVEAVEAVDHRVFSHMLVLVAALVKSEAAVLL